MRNFNVILRTKRQLGKRLLLGVKSAKMVKCKVCIRRKSLDERLGVAIEVENEQNSDRVLCVRVEQVECGSAAQRAGLMPADAILRVDGVHVRKCSRAQCLRLFAEARLQTELVILPAEIMNIISRIGLDGQNKKMEQKLKHNQQKETFVGAQAVQRQNWGRGTGRQMMENDAHAAQPRHSSQRLLPAGRFGNDGGEFDDANSNCCPSSHSAAEFPTSSSRYPRGTDAGGSPEQRQMSSLTDGNEWRTTALLGTVPRNNDQQRPTNSGDLCSSRRHRQTNGRRGAAEGVMEMEEEEEEDDHFDEDSPRRRGRRTERIFEDGKGEGRRIVKGIHDDLVGSEVGGGTLPRGLRKIGSDAEEKAGESPQRRKRQQQQRRRTNAKAGDNEDGKLAEEVPSSINLLLSTVTPTTPTPNTRIFDEMDRRINKSQSALRLLGLSSPTNNKTASSSSTTMFGQSTHNQPMPGGTVDVPSVDQLIVLPNSACQRMETQLVGLEDVNSTTNSQADGATGQNKAEAEPMKPELFKTQLWLDFSRFEPEKVIGRPVAPFTQSSDSEPEMDNSDAIDNGPPSSHQNHCSSSSPPSMTTVVAPPMASLRSLMTVVAPPMVSSSLTTVVAPPMTSSSPSLTTVVAPPMASSSLTTVVAPPMTSSSPSLTTVVAPPMASSSLTTVVAPPMTSSSPSLTTVVAPPMTSSSPSLTTVVAPPMTSSSLTTVVAPPMTSSPPLSPSRFSSTIATNSSDYSPAPQQKYCQKQALSEPSQHELDIIQNAIGVYDFSQYRIRTVLLLRPPGINEGTVGLLLGTMTEGFKPVNGPFTILVSKVTSGSIACKNGHLRKGDRKIQVFFIQHQSTMNMSVVEARKSIKDPSPAVHLVVGRKFTEGRFS
uniref:PDZ domain-containing protein n=1 Tax=Globodera rostochiensis TaxID=31243 RepID=A0A914HTR7_GLORO